MLLSSQRNIKEVTVSEKFPIIVFFFYIEFEGKWILSRSGCMSVQPMEQIITYRGLMQSMWKLLWLFPLILIGLHQLLKAKQNFPTDKQMAHYHSPMTVCIFLFSFIFLFSVKDIWCWESDHKTLITLTCWKRGNTYTQLCNSVSLVTHITASPT